MKWITRFLLFLLVLALGLTLTNYKAQKSGQYHQKVETKLFGPVESKGLSFSADAYEHFGEGILGSESHRYKKLLQTQLKWISLNDRKDLSTPLLTVSYKDKILTFNDKEEYSLQKISLQDFAGTNAYLFKVQLELGRAKFCIYPQNYPSLVIECPLAANGALKGGTIGPHKLDPYLLVRQKASWLGQDLFLKKYGGEEYAFQAQSERIDFMQESPYSIFVKKGDLLVWKNDQWQKADQDSQNYPLMEIAKIDDRQIQCLIWDVQGIYKEQITLNRANVPPFPTAFAPLKFMGAKAKRKWLIKVGKTRMAIEPDDWIVHRGNKWEKLDSIEGVDHYIEKINAGELLIVKELKEQNGKKYLQGELFNATRSNSMDYVLELSPVTLKK